MVPTCELRDVHKTFGQNHVLKGITLSLPANQVTVLMGANGAGKSTLVNILCGVHRRDAGEIELFEQPYTPSTPIEAIQAGIVTVHQAINDGVVPDLDVASNLVLDHFTESRHGFFIRPRRVREKAQKIASAMGLTLDLDQPVSQAGIAERQLISIARAMARDPKVLILDEPTSSLSAAEAERLFELIDRLRKTGVAVLYITHRMSDIRRIADRIVCMRDGQISGLFEETPPDYEAAMTAMLGHKLTEVNVKIPAALGTIIEFENLTLSENRQPINLAVHRNEIVAITGLLGSGKGKLAAFLFGLAKPVSGRILLEGKPFSPRNPTDAIKAGVFLCPKDRASNGVIPGFHITDNLTLPFLKYYSRLSFLRSLLQKQESKQMIGQLGIVCQSDKDAIGTLSGGNQQKVMVGRWLAQASKLLVLEEPFQGVDIRSRRDIGDYIRATATERAVLVFVAELDEALEVADRIVVINEEEIAGEHKNDDVDINGILAQVTGKRKAAEHMFKQNQQIEQIA